MTGWVVGLLVYAGVVLMAVAGFSPVIPLVVIPPVLMAMIGANNLLGGGRGYGRSSAARSAGPGPAPSPSVGGNGSGSSESASRAARRTGEEPGDPV